MRVNHPGKSLRRLTYGTSAKLTLSSVAFLLLTAAKGDSCLPGDETQPEPEPPPPTEVCPPGSHVETICEGGDPGYGAHDPGYGAHDPGLPPDCGHPNGPPLPMGETGSGAYDGYTGSGCDNGNTGSHEPGCDCGCGCYDICVPDEVCPPGSYEEWICEDPSQPLDFCEDPNGCPPEPGQCYPLCVPFEPCGPDMHEEWMCFGEPPPPPDGPCLHPDGCEPPPPPPEDACELICVPNDGCGPDMHEEWICDEPPPPPDGPCLDPDGCLPPEPGPEGCYPTCVPDGPCPPGSDVIIACNDELGECWAECVPVDPGCPPDMVPEPICDEWDCWIECLPL